MRRSLIIIVALFSTLAARAQLRVSDNEHYRQTSDGKPFFWLGDTAWEIFRRLTRKEADKYLQNRTKDLPLLRRAYLPNWMAFMTQIPNFTLPQPPASSK